MSAPIVLTQQEETEIRAWLTEIGENAEAIDGDIQVAQSHRDTADWLLARARGGAL